MAVCDERIAHRFGQRTVETFRFVMGNGDKKRIRLLFFCFFLGRPARLTPGGHSTRKLRDVGDAHVLERLGGEG